MRTPKGFGRNYFTLASIQAHSSGVTLHAQTTAVAHYTVHHFDEQEASIEAPPIQTCALETLALEDDQRSRPCHCNRFFKRRARTLRKLAFLTQPPICKCRKTKSGIAPPWIDFFSYFLFY